MKNLERTNQFKKEFKLMLKRNKNQKKLSTVVELLINEKPLPTKYKDHRLVGNYGGSRELHIESDWLLIYRVTKSEVTLERTGTHSDLFKK